MKKIIIASLMLLPLITQAGYVGGGSGTSGTDSNAIHTNESGEILGLTEKVSPVSADVLVIEDSEASNVKKKVQLSNLPAGTDATAIHTDAASEISGVSEKAAAVAGDMVVIEDSEDSENKKMVQVSNIADGLDHADLGAGIGTNTHSQIDTAITNSTNHIASSANPHTVTFAQVDTNMPEEINGHIETADDKDYTLVQKAQYARQVTSIAILCTSGAASAALEVDTVGVTDCDGIAASTAENEVTCDTGATNDLAAGETLDLAISNNSSCTDLKFTVLTTRD